MFGESLSVHLKIGIGFGTTASMKRQDCTTSCISVCFNGYTCPKLNLLLCTFIVVLGTPCFRCEPVFQFGRYCEFTRCTEWSIQLGIYTPLATDLACTVDSGAQNSRAYVTQKRSAIHYSTARWIYMKLCYPAFHCITMHNISLCFTTFYYIALHYITTYVYILYFQISFSCAKKNNRHKMKIGWFDTKVVAYIHIKKQTCISWNETRQNKKKKKTSWFFFLNFQLRSLKNGEIDNQIEPCPSNQGYSCCAAVPVTVAPPHLAGAEPWNEKIGCGWLLHETAKGWHPKIDPLPRNWIWKSWSFWKGISFSKGSMFRFYANLRRPWGYTPPKFNSSPWKIDGWKTIVSFGKVTFQGLC